MSESREIVVLARDCMALMVPSGARILLHEGTEVTITQALGNAFTINVYGNLARIESKDADALGKEVKDPLQDLSSDATVEEKVWTMLKTVYDPEIPVNIVDLGLVYTCQVKELSSIPEPVIPSVLRDNASRFLRTDGPSSDRPEETYPKGTGSALLKDTRDDKAKTRDDTPNTGDNKAPTHTYEVLITMTLTAPGCGMGPVIAEDAKQKILKLSEVVEANVEIVFDPPWDRSMMSDVAKLELGMF